MISTPSTQDVARIETTGASGEPETTPWALIVDDNAIDRRMAGAHVQRITGLKVQFAANGLDALKAIAQSKPEVILTDMQMPEMGGLELVDEIVTHHPAVPVIVMTSKGSEEIAIEALQRGAASYVPKRLIQTLDETLPVVLARAKIDRRKQELNQYLDRLHYSFVLENDPVLVPLLVAQLQDHIYGMKLCNQNEKTRVGVALEEALLNGLYHGNLEVSSDLKQDGSNAFHQLADQRRQTPPYRDRRLFVQADLTTEEARFEIRDEGPGFDPSKLPDPTDPENLLKASGRGILLICTFMDEVIYSPTGNQITMCKRRKMTG
ncbi:MAG TPA: response regulator [Gemmataceae bacterium]|nr:response regulator [Gemmataceae bacterium]